MEKHPRCSRVSPEAGEGSSPPPLPRLAPPLHPAPRAPCLGFPRPAASVRGQDRGGSRGGGGRAPAAVSVSVSLPTLTLPAPSPAAGGARSAALQDPPLPPCPVPSFSEPPSGRRGAARRGASRYVRPGSRCERARKGAGAREGEAAARPGSAHTLGSPELCAPACGDWGGPTLLRTPTTSRRRRARGGEWQRRTARLTSRPAEGHATGAPWSTPAPRSPSLPGPPLCEP